MTERLPAFQGSPTGNRRYWTKQRVLAGLRRAAAAIDGPLPCRDAAYSAIKKGHMDWPPASRVLEYFHGMARGWLAAGVSPWRVSLKNLDWTQQEDDYLLEHAGSLTLAAIARHLGRSYQSVRVRLGSKGFGITARGNQGYLSAAELAKEYHCPYHRIRKLLAEGAVKGTYDKARNSWKVDPADIDEEAERLLRQPKVHSYKSSPPDMGDYYRRYGLKRQMREGRLVVVEVAS